MSCEPPSKIVESGLLTRVRVCTGYKGFSHWSGNVFRPLRNVEPQEVSLPKQHVA